MDGNSCCLDMGIASGNIASKCSWAVYRAEGMGSDHFPLITEQGNGRTKDEDNAPTWKREKANWKLFGSQSELCGGEQHVSAETEEFRNKITKGIRKPASLAIPRIPARIKARESVLGWNKKCAKVMTERNQAHQKAKMVRS